MYIKKGVAENFILWLGAMLFKKNVDCRLQMSYK